MRKLIIALFVFCASVTLNALPIGNPADPGLIRNGMFWCSNDGSFCDPCFNWWNAWSFRAGFYGDYVFNRHMEVDGNHHPDIEKVEIFTNAGFFALNIINRIDLFATLGTSNINLKTNGLIFVSPQQPNVNGPDKIESETAFSWSVGARAILWECGCFTLGAEGQYFETRPDVRVFNTIDSDAFYLDNTHEIHYWEGQVGLAAAYRINCFSPYLGVKWARSQMLFHPNKKNPQGINFDGEENKKSWGYAVGVSFVPCDYMDLTVEGRWADEKAVYVNGQIRF